MNDVQILGPTIGFSVPDSCDSWVYSAGASCFGQGSCNNTNFMPQFNPLTGSGVGQLNTPNLGLIQRQSWYNCGPDGSAYGANGLMDLVNHTQTLNSVAPYISYPNVNVQMIEFIAHIRLRDLSDFFAKLPPVRGVLLRFQITVNQGYFTVVKSSSTNAYGTDISVPPVLAVAATASPALSLVASQFASTNPVMIANSFGSAVAAAGNVTVPAITAGAAVAAQVLAVP